MRWYVSSLCSVFNRASSHSAGRGVALVLLVLSVMVASATQARADPDLKATGNSSLPSDVTEPVPGFLTAWLSPESRGTRAVSWGDVDGDGDLDLAIGNYTDPVELYLNNGGVLTTQPVWQSEEQYLTTSLAWGDADSDGDLDLAVGNFWTPNCIYRNDDGMLSISAAWRSTESDGTNSLAWGDYDDDGDLDLAVGNGTFEQSRLYRNDGSLTFSLAWSTADEPGAESIAWGDYDGDGDLDLAMGGQHVWVYGNDKGGLTPTPVWATASYDQTSGVAWGDFDGDGDVDLAAGNAYRPSRIYRNEQGVLNTNPVWSSADSPDTTSIAFGDFDGDGDLDLAAAGTAYNRLYRNDAGNLTSDPIWKSTEADRSEAIAWGDFDGDHDLDLVVGNDGLSRGYRNDGVGLSRMPVWQPAIWDNTDNLAWGDIDDDGDLDLMAANSNYGGLYLNNNGALSTNETSSLGPLYVDDVAWGDYDLDGDLDLATGGAGPSLYLNDDGTLRTSPIWQAASSIGDAAVSVAWGDYDNDGDLDLGAGFDFGRPIRIYRNDKGTLTAVAVWSSNEAMAASDIAWGDYDGDGDLDLVAGSSSFWHGPIRLYRNDAGRMGPSAVWTSTDASGASAVAWGDYDADGDLDLAAAGERVQVYRNEHSLLGAAPAWVSIEANSSTSVAWGDYDNDGDLDLVVSNDGQPSRIYRNDNGILAASAAWSSGEATNAHATAWGDYDGDGDIDLAVGVIGGWNRLYRNGPAIGAGLGLPGKASMLTVRTVRPAPPSDAAFYSAPTVWPQPGSSVAIQYSLVQAASLTVARIRAYYSLDGGGKWLPAIAASGTITTNLATSPTGITYTYNWDVFASGFFGQSDNVVFRIVAVPDLHPVKNSVPGPFLYGSNASSTFPFRVRGTQVRVLEGGQPVKDALVYRQPAGDNQPAQRITSLAGEPFKTDGQGYLQGRGTINVGDRLYALVSVMAADTYTLYHTNAAPTPTGLDGFTVTEPGVQTLDVSTAHPLVLFNLDVALEWDARQDGQFLAQLQYDLQRASEFLYDWTNGQAALGRLRIYHDARRQPEVDGWQPWLDAHVRIYASNRLRPSAVQGGIVSAPFTDTLKTNIVYYPGQLYMGSAWNRYGDAGSSLDEDWPRTLAHELGHYALYLQDNYLGRNAQGQIVPVDGCSGAMADPYRDDADQGYGEFHPAAGWLPACANTLSHLETGRSDWATITTFYGQLDGVTANAGPSTLPLAVTSVDFVDPPDPPSTLKAPIFFLTQDGQRVQPGGSAQAFLYQGDWVTDLGRPTLDQVLARGAQPGDRVCVYEPSAGRLGCETVTLGDEQLALVSQPGWQPDIQVSPVTSKTLILNVTNVPAGLTLKARLYPLDFAAGEPIALSAAGGVYTGTFNQSTPTFEGYVQVWVAEAEPRREVVVDFTLGGNPGHQRTGGTGKRSDGGHQRTGGAPVMSADGQVILFAPDVETPDEWFYTLQAVTSGVPAPPWATLVGQAYRLTATAKAPSLVGSSLSFSYLGREVPPGEEQWLKLYFGDGAAWQPLATTLDMYHNMASAPVQGPGIYALMASIPIPLQGPGWNQFGWPVPGRRPIEVGLGSISGSYTIVYSYEAEDRSDPFDPWKMYAPAAPPYANDLAELKFVHGYWINISTSMPITLWVNGSSAAAQDPITVPYLPASYYGRVSPAEGFTPAPGMLVNALIEGNVCGQARIIEYESELVYAINVWAESETRAGCGTAGRRVAFEIGYRRMAGTVEWDNNRVQEFPLHPGLRVYLPAIIRQ